MARPLSLDTSRQAEEIQIEVLRRLSPGRRLVLAAADCESARLMAKAGLRARHPGESDELLDRRWKGLVHGEELASRIWGPLPSS